MRVDVIDQILTFAGRLTVTGMLLLTVVALLMEKVVPGAAMQRELADRDRQLAERDRQLADMARERDEWKQLAMSSTRLAGDAARAVDPTVPPPPPPPPAPARPTPAVGAQAPVATLPDPAAAEAATGGGGEPS
jgi:hypothetical protein